MYNLKVLVAALFAVFVLASCGPDSKEKVAQDAISLMGKMATILEGVSDKSSAETAKPKLEALAKTKESIMARLKTLGLKEEDLKKELKDEKYKAQVEAIMKKMMASMMKTMMNKEVQEVLEDTMKKLN